MDSTEEREPQTISGQDLERWRTPVIAGAVIAAIILLGRVTPFSPFQDAFGVFGWVTEQAVDITRELFEEYGELTVFFAPLLENTLFLGALIPGTLVMIMAGVATENGIIDLQIAIPLAIAGAIIGDTISYWIGRFGWQKLGPESRLVKWSESIREPLMNHSVWLILSYHFAGYSRLVGPASAGFLRVPFTRWMLLDYIGVALWVVVFIMGGYALAAAFDLNLRDPSEGDIQRFELIIFGLFAIGVFFVLRRARQSRRTKPAASNVSAGTDSASADGADPKVVAIDTVDASHEETTQHVR